VRHPTLKRESVHRPGAKESNCEKKNLISGKVRVREGIASAHYMRNLGSEVRSCSALKLPIKQGRKGIERNYRQKESGAARGREREVRQKHLRNKGQTPEGGDLCLQDRVGGRPVSHRRGAGVERE